MANIIKRVWNQNRMVQIEDLKGMTFQAEQAGHTFQISGIDDDGNTVALTGTPAGVLLRPDNTDVALTCSVSGGVVSATLPANCYDVPGRFGLTIFITSGSSKTAIYAAVGTVSRTSSGSVAPGTSQSVVDLINAINAAVNSIPASYSALLADIAPTYSNSALYSVGQYAWYDGDLKRCIVPITTAESYTAAHWTSAVLGQDVSDLKSALYIYTGNSEIQFSDPTLKQYINTSGSTVSWDTPSTSSITNVKWAVIPCTPGDVFTINGKGGDADRLWAFADSSKNILDPRSGVNATASNLVLTAPNNAAYLIINDEQNKKSYCGEFAVLRIENNETAIKETKSAFKGTPLNLIPWNEINYNGFINGNTGVFTPGSSGSGLDCCTDYIPVEPNVRYNFSYVSGANWNIVSYDENKDYIEGSQHFYFDTSSDARYIRMSFRSSDVNFKTQILSKLVQRTTAAQTKIIEHVYIANTPELKENNLQLGVRDIYSPYSLSNSSTRCTTIAPLLLRKGTVIRAIKGKVGALIYDLTLTFIAAHGFGFFEKLTLETDCYVNFNFAKADDSTITSSDYSEIIQYAIILEKEDQYIIDALGKCVESALWRNGSVGNKQNAIGISTQNILNNYYASSVSFLVNRPLTAGHKYRFQLSTYSVSSGDAYDNLNQRITVEKTELTDGNYFTFDLNDGSVGFAIALYEVDENGDYVPLRVTSVDTTQIFIFRGFKSDSVTKDYSVSTDFTKKEVHLRYLGKLKGVQSFCKYDGKYYSTDGTTVYVQDESFNDISSTALSLGHANAFQLGHNGKVYVSGWEDQKVYVVDIETMEVDETISLPTTGYTTCAVDDVNSLVYIFQRDTYPNTEENYNLIVYDYLHNSIVRQSKTTKAFGAMQAIDFIDGKIIVLNGLGTSEVPNGYRIYNTSGDVIAEYVIGSYEDVEPEGIFVDRQTKEMFISYVNKSVYKIH